MASKKEIATLFAKINGGIKSSPCACMGIECGQTDCIRWWEFAFEDDEIFQKAEDTYDAILQNATEQNDNTTFTKFHAMSEKNA